MIAELVAAFSTPEAFVQLVMLAFLEVVLGIDNIVFISITAARLPRAQQHIGRRLGLAAAMVTRIALLFTLGWIMHLTKPLTTLDLGFYTLEITGKNLILLAGGVYLVYKGVSELREMLALTEERAAQGGPDQPGRAQLGLGRAVATIAVMDIVFSLDSVITAVGMVDHVVIAAIAIVVAILFMMAFADVVGDFINSNPEIKLLALFFILAIGVLLVLEFLQLDINTWYVYVAMLFSLVVTLLQMAYRRNLAALESKAPDAEVAEAGSPEVEGAPEGRE